MTDTSPIETAHGQKVRPITEFLWGRRGGGWAPPPEPSCKSSVVRVPTDGGPCSELALYFYRPDVDCAPDAVVRIPGQGRYVFDGGIYRWEPNR